MKQLIAVIGPRRSGLHAVANWLIGLHPGRVRFVNDPPIAKPPHPTNFRGCYEYDVAPDQIRLRPTLHLFRDRSKQLNWQIATGLPWPWNGVVRRVIKRFWEPKIMQASCTFPELDGTGQVPPDTHIVLFENLTPRDSAKLLPAWLAAYRAGAGLPAAQREDIIIVLRSPWNCLASTLKHHHLGAAQMPRSHNPWTALTNALGPSPDDRTYAVPPEQVGELWTEYAREIIGESQHLSLPQWHTHSLLYDAWIATPAQRVTTAAELGCSPNDLGLAEIAEFGGGSSFVGQNAPPDSPRELTNRWRHYQNHPLMAALFASPDIRRLATALEMLQPDTDRPSTHLA